MTVPLRPCSTCRTPVPGGRCPRHPPASARYRPNRPSHAIYRDPLYRALRPVILNRDGHTCQYCDNPATTTDHVIPHSRGGASTPDNMVAACDTCNRSKKNRTLLEWIATGLAPTGARAILQQRRIDGLSC